MFKWDKKVAEVYRFMPPPGPPSRSELKVYEKFVKPFKDKRRAKILILGSTPGLRSLCRKYRLRAFCVEYRRENFFIAKTAIKQKGREQLLVADWRTMRLKGKYDLILGDIAFAMVPFADLDKILMRLRHALKSGGLIVHRTWMRQKGHFKNFEYFLKHFHAKRRKYTHPFTSLLIPFVSFFYDEKRERILFSRNLPKLERFVQQGLLPKSDYDYMVHFLGNYKLPGCYPLKNKYERKLKKYFSIKKILHGKDWFKNYSLIYVFSQKY